MIDDDADQLVVFLDVDGRRFAGRADDADRVGAFVDVEIDEFAQRRKIEASVGVHGRDNRYDRAGDGVHE